MLWLFFIHKGISKDQLGPEYLRSCMLLSIKVIKRKFLNKPIIVYVPLIRRQGLERKSQQSFCICVKHNFFIILSVYAAKYGISALINPDFLCTTTKQIEDERLKKMAGYKNFAGFKAFKMKSQLRQDRDFSLGSEIGRKKLKVGVMLTLRSYIQ